MGGRLCVVVIIVGWYVRVINGSIMRVYVWYDIMLMGGRLCVITIVGWYVRVNNGRGRDI
jgi:hypothetical protein